MNYRVLNSRKEVGAVLVVGLLMLVMTTLMATTSFIMSTTNLKSVGNVQFRQEAVAAANASIEQVLGSPFTDAPATEEITIDIDNSGTTDYSVSIAQPDCISAMAAGSSAPSSIALPAMAGSADWNTVWELDATVSDPVSGTSARVRSGVRVLLTEAEKNSVCP